MIRARHAGLRVSRRTVSAAALLAWTGVLLASTGTAVHAEPLRSVVALDAGSGPVAHDAGAVAAKFAAMFIDGASDIAPTIRAMVSGGGRPPSPMPSSSAPYSPPSSGGRETVIMGPDADPNFARWHKDAQEKLKAEGKVGTVKPHPLALAHPGKMVVVCEAGCRTPKDEIVYIASLVPAVLPADQTGGSLEATSSGGASAAASEVGEVTCIAGCYVRPERAKPEPRRRADVDQKPMETPVQRYAGIVQTAMRSALAAAPAPDVGAPARSARVADERATQRQRFARVERGFNGAIVQVRKPPALQRAHDPQKFAHTHVRASKRVTVAATDRWITTVVAAPSVETRSKAARRTKGLSRLAQAAKLRRAQGSPWQVRVVGY